MAEIYLIEDCVRRRDNTDHIMPLWLPFLPLLLMIGSTIWLITLIGFYEYFEMYRYSMSYPDVVEAYIVVATVVAIVGVLINAYVVYKWVWRRNEHFKRQKMMFNAIKDFLKGKRYNVGKLELICMEIDVEENERNPVLWALVQFIPYVGSFLLIYVYHFLNKDFYKHEIREDQYLSALSEISSGRGFDFYYVRYNKIPDRSTILYFVITLITFGLFGLYWVYTLTKDPNNHFVEHRRWEDSLLNILRRI